MMRATALRRYQRLEAEGRWRSAREAEPQEVIVSIGEATLVLSDPRSDTPLAHWSLPAVHRLNPGAEPAIYAPDLAADVGETLEIDDRLMNDAIGRVHLAIDARRPHPGRVRGSLLLAFGLAMVLAGALWLPGALRSHAGRIIPLAERAEIGTALLVQLQEQIGLCPLGENAAAMGRFQQRLGLGAHRIAVLDEDSGAATPLPGNVLILGRDLLHEGDDPAVVAGHLLRARQAADLEDPLAALLDRARLRDVLSLLTTGRLPREALEGAGQWLLERRDTPSGEGLLRAFDAAGVPTTPYALTLAPGSALSLMLQDRDPYRSTPAPPLLSDADWVSLQQICRS